jgi:hypothetical protein
VPSYILKSSKFSYPTVETTEGDLVRAGDLEITEKKLETQPTVRRRHNLLLVSWQGDLRHLSEEVI